jgi:hypothetical protein
LHLLNWINYFHDLLYVTFVLFTFTSRRGNNSYQPPVTTLGNRKSSAPLSLKVGAFPSEMAAIITNYAKNQVGKVKDYVVGRTLSEYNEAVIHLGGHLWESKVCCFNLCLSHTC